MLRKNEQKYCRITCYFVELFYYMENATMILPRKYLNVFEMKLL